MSAQNFRTDINAATAALAGFNNEIRPSLDDHFRASDRLDYLLRAVTSRGYDVEIRITAGTGRLKVDLPEVDEKSRGPA